MISFGRIAVKIVASAGVCATAVAVSPTAAAVPLKTGGYACDASAVAPAAGAPAAAAAAAPCAAPAVESSGIVGPLAAAPVVPAAVPPVPAVVPPVPAAVPPVVPPIPAGLPIGAPIPIAAAPAAIPMDMGGVADGKEARTLRPVDAGGPTPNLPTQPGPQN
ncbi:hypothetical protein SBE55_01485 [Mycolicibacterium sp. 141076]|uniref:Beta-xylosidase n=1 Tax=Mycolicibacterium mucogenicum TaxID=56689 RepID=A0A1A0MS12_MYCMU|nr:MULTISPECIES: hypothetical protein [Mycolicibacterium]MDX1876480.1 hypothetical protein [Mycolicibacterium sp. 141076]OBA87573.1 hypothetical protein A5642_19430 [Mycolicibacterium mucogenicum]